MNQLSTLSEIKAFESEKQEALADNTYLALKNAASKFQDNIALRFFVDGNHFDKAISWTYGAFMQEINAVANMFHQYGLQKEDAVSYILPNIPATCFTFFGAEAAGIVNPINPMLDSEQIAEIVNASGSKIIVTLAPFPQTEIWEKVSNILAKTPSVKTVFTVFLGNYLGMPSPEPPTSRVEGIEILDFFKTKEVQNKNSLDFELDKNIYDTASYFHTGGTTGMPKLAKRTHKNELFNVQYIGKILQFEERTVIFCGLPWFHVNGVIVTGAFPLFNGNEIVLGTPNGYRGNGVISNFWKIVAHFKINLFSCVPTILQSLLQVPIDGIDISSLKYACCGAAPLSLKLFEDFEKTTQIKILEGYGFTEGCCVSTLNPPHGIRKIGSIGLAIPFHDLKVVNLDYKGQYVSDALSNEIGIFVAKGGNIMESYKEQKDNEKAYIFDGKDSWYNTGDMGKQDEDGYFWITGRKKELIIRGGHNIDPKSIEEPLSTHPAVAAVAAVPRPDAYSGEIPVAYVELKQGQNISEDELMEFAKTHIYERAAVPKKIYIIPQMPLTAVGKIFKPELADRQIKEIFEENLLTIAEIQNATVHIDYDAHLGRIACVKIESEYSTEDLQEKIKIVLGNFTTKYKLI